MPAAKIKITAASIPQPLIALVSSLVIQRGSLPVHVSSCLPPLRGAGSISVRENVPGFSRALLILLRYHSGIKRAAKSRLSGLQCPVSGPNREERLC